MDAAKLSDNHRRRIRALAFGWAFSTRSSASWSRGMPSSKYPNISWYSFRSSLTSECWRNHSPSRASSSREVSPAINRSSNSRMSFSFSFISYFLFYWLYIRAIDIFFWFPATSAFLPSKARQIQIQGWCPRFALFPQSFSSLLVADKAPDIGWRAAPWGVFAATVRSPSFPLPHRAAHSG